MDDKKPPPVGIWIRPAARGTIVHGNETIGMHVGVVDEGVNSTIESNLIHSGNSPDEAKPTADSRGYSDDHWYKKPIGIVGMSVAAGLLVGAATWAIAHYLG